MNEEDEYGGAEYEMHSHETGDGGNRVRGMSSERRALGLDFICTDKGGWWLVSDHLIQEAQRASQRREKE